MDPILESRAVAAYLGMAVGDALGATVEFMTPREIQVQHGVHDEIVGGGWLRLKKGQVTDDTEMSLALGDAILQQGRVDATAAAEAFSDWMRTKPVDIGHTVRRGIVHYRRTSQPWVEPNEYNAGNGACMRTLPVALCTLGWSEEAIVAAHNAQAHTTHNCPLSDLGTLCVIELIHQGLRGESKAQLRETVEQLVAREPQYRFDKKPVENPSGFIVDTLKVVFQALFNTDSFEEGMVETVNRGGDADTTGAIYGMIAGALYDSPAIPQRWRDRVDRKVRDRCTRQALALLRLSSP